MPFDDRLFAERPPEQIDQAEQGRRPRAPQVVNAIAGRGDRLVDGRHHAVDDVVDECIVAAAAAVAEQRNRLARGDRPPELVDGQIRPLARAVDREEAQAGDVEPVKMMGGEQQELARALGRRVGRQRLEAGIGLLERRLTVEPIDRRRRREDEPRAAGGARGVDDPLGADQVHVGVARRLGQRRPHARQRRQVDHHVGAGLPERARQRRRVANVPLDERERRNRPEPRQVLFLGRPRIERIEVVDAHDLVAARAEALAQMRADEPGRAGDQDSHGGAIVHAPRRPAAGARAKIPRSPSRR